jgi:hypothetical protein
VISIRVSYTSFLQRYIYASLLLDEDLNGLTVQLRNMSTNKKVNVKKKKLGILLKIFFAAVFMNVHHI